MEVKQLYGLVNVIAGELTGNTALVAENLSNLVDVGEAVFNASSVDNYVKKLVDKVGKVVFDNRTFTSKYPSVLMDSWEFGAVKQKISCSLIDAKENDSWDLTAGKSYDTNVFYAPTITSKFWSKKVTFEVAMSFTEQQIKSSFNSAEEMNGFISMIENAIEKSMTMRIDSLIQRTVNAMITSTAAAGGASYINLLSEYKTITGNTTTTAASCMSDKEFIRYAAYKMGVISDRLTTINQIYNLGKSDKFTPKEDQRCIMLSEFKRAADVYLQSDTRHNELTELPAADVIPFWQGSGQDYAFSAVSQVFTVSSDGKTEQKVNGVLAVLFDHEALGVSNLDRRVTTQMNPRAEFTTSWYKFDAGYFNDQNENFVVFYVAD